jgi:hypothetical protein
MNLASAGSPTIVSAAAATPTAAEAAGLRRALLAVDDRRLAASDLVALGRGDPVAVAEVGVGERQVRLSAVELAGSEALGGEQRVGGVAGRERGVDDPLERLERCSRGGDPQKLLAALAAEIARQHRDRQLLGGAPRLGEAVDERHRVRHHPLAPLDRRGQLGQVVGRLGGDRLIRRHLDGALVVLDRFADPAARAIPARGLEADLGLLARAGELGLDRRLVGAEIAGAANEPDEPLGAAGHAAEPEQLATLAVDGEEHRQRGHVILAGQLGPRLAVKVVADKDRLAQGRLDLGGRQHLGLELHAALAARRAEGDDHRDRASFGRGERGVEVARVGRGAQRRQGDGDERRPHSVTPPSSRSATLALTFIMKAAPGSDLRLR